MRLPVITYPDHSPSKCPLSDTADLDKPTLAEHVITNHTKSDNSWCTLLDSLTTMDPTFFSHVIIGERERANLVVRSSGIFCLYIIIIYIVYAAVRRVSAHARLLTRFFLSEIIYKFYTFSHTSPIDRSSQPDNSSPFDGMLCNLR